MASVEPRARCPHCDQVGCRLEHKTRTGGREGYTDPAGRKVYRCLKHGVFLEGGEDVKTASIQAVALAGRRLQKALDDIRVDQDKAAAVQRVKDSARILYEACEEATA